MNSKLLDFRPRELKFIYELKKQSSCSIQLVNNSNHHVAFKVKTTSPKRYCVQPNTGIITPKSTCVCTVYLITMQAQQSASPDMIRKDKFLIQSTVVPIGTTNKDITASTFAKDDGKYIDDSKLKVILVSPPNSPVLLPMHGTLKPMPAHDASILNYQMLSRVESVTEMHKDNEHVEELKMENVEDLKQVKDVEFKTMKDLEELKLVKEIEEIKLKLSELESKLTEAEVTILRLTEEKRSIAQEGESLQQELTLLRSKRVAKRVQVGFPLLYVCMVALISIMLGYFLHG